MHPSTIYRRSRSPEKQEQYRATTRKWRARNANALKLYRKLYYARTRKLNPQHFREKERCYEKRNRKRINARQRASYAKNRARYAAYEKKSTAKHRDKILEKHAAYYAKNKVVIREKQRIYNSKTEVKAAKQAAVKRRKERDDCFRVRCNLSSRINIALRKWKGGKHAKTEELIGCPIPLLKLWIESKFRPGMSWENYGVNGWHIDHKIPCAEFDLRDRAQQLRCFHYSNLQPLWRLDNIRKGKSLTV